MNAADRAELVDEHDAGEHDRPGLRSVDCPLCSPTVELEDAMDLLGQALAKVYRVETSLPDSAARERLRQVRAALGMVQSNDHYWLGRAGYTLQDSINELGEER